MPPPEESPGLPTVAGVLYHITFKVTDNVLASATKNLTITILAAPGIITTSLPNGAVSANYSYAMLGYRWRTSL